MMLTTIEPDEQTTDRTDGNYDRWVPTGYFACDFEGDVNRALDRLAELPANWDAEGAPPIDHEIIQAARDFVARLPEDIASVPAVVPSAAGSLQFEWNEDRRSLELEIESPSVIHYLKWDPDRGIEEEDVFDINDTDRAVFLIRWFMQGAAHV